MVSSGSHGAPAPIAAPDRHPLGGVPAHRVRPVANAESVIEVFIDGHPAARQSPAPRSFLDLEEAVLQTDRVVSIHHSLVLEREDSVYSISLLGVYRAVVATTSAFFVVGRCGQ